MNFPQSETPQKENRQKRSIDEVQLMAGNIQPRIQLALSKAGKLERKTTQTQPRKKGTKKKPKIDNKQVTLLEKWNIQDKGVKVGNTVNRSRNKRQTKNKCTHKRYRDKRHNAATTRAEYVIQEENWLSATHVE